MPVCQGFNFLNIPYMSVYAFPHSYHLLSHGGHHSTNARGANVTDHVFCELPARTQLYTATSFRQCYNHATKENVSCGLLPPHAMLRPAPLSRGSLGSSIMQMRRGTPWQRHPATAGARRQRPGRCILSEGIYKHAYRITLDRNRDLD